MGVRCADRKGVDPQVMFGLTWVRRRQRSLARAVLALFCAAWLQAAIVPCVMAHDDREHDGGAAGHPCLYCPPDADHGSAGGCDGRDCAYPHEPQVDARAVGVIFTALPVAFVLPAQAVSSATDCSVVAVPEAIPRIRLSVSYCRFIE